MGALAKMLAVSLVLLAVPAMGCGAAPDEIVSQTEGALSQHNVHALYTISYAPNSYVIGNAYDGWTDELRESAVFRKGPGNAGGVNYQCGVLFGENFDHCGWIDRNVVGGSAENASCGGDCPSTYETSLFRSTYTDGTINPDVSDGSPTYMNYHGSGCTDVNGYGNVDPWKVPATPANSLGPVAHGHFLLWRYVSKGGGWVLVHDPAHASPGVPNWYFVQRGCLTLSLNPPPSPPPALSSPPPPPATPPPPPPPPPPPLHCCALCNDRQDAYHANASSMSCKQAAIDFCSVNGRGGVNLFYEGDCPEAP